MSPREIIETLCAAFGLVAIVLFVLLFITGHITFPGV